MRALADALLGEPAALFEGDELHAATEVATPSAGTPAESQLLRRTTAASDIVLAHFAYHFPHRREVEYLVLSQSTLTIRNCQSDADSCRIASPYCGQASARVASVGLTDSKRVALFCYRCGL